MYTPPVFARGYYGIGIYQAKFEVNIGVLFRSAFCFGADFTFTVGRRYSKQASDTTCTMRHVPHFEYTDLDDLIKHLPKGCPLIGVEQTKHSYGLDKYCHREQSCYILGAEDKGLPESVLGLCKDIVEIPHSSMCLNVSVAGSIVMSDRKNKRAMIPSDAVVRKHVRNWTIE